MSNRQKRNPERLKRHRERKAATFCAARIVHAVAWRVSRSFLEDRRRRGLVIDLPEGGSYTTTRRGSLRPIEPEPAA